DADEFDKAWSRMKTEFSDQEAIIGYLETHYLPFKEEWACPWISRLRNFGQRTSSPTETAHRELKGYLVNGKSSLLKLHEVILEMLKNKEIVYKERIAMQNARLRTEFQGPSFDWLGPTNKEVSHKAIDKLVDNEALTRDDFHEFWWLERSLLEEFPILNVKDPATVKGKGRPRGSGPFTGQETKAPEAPPSTAPAVLQTSTPPVPASGTNPRLTKPSVRRNRSRWEESGIDELEEEAALMTVRPAKRLATHRKSAEDVDFGGYKSSSFISQRLGFRPECAGCTGWDG
ncbi:hypothetical protein C8A00DRAFT_39134, partial [Chaetomidium leptoderma]